MQRFFVFISIATLLPAMLFGQKYQIRNYNSESGLPSSSIYRIFKDHRGFLWFCSDYGITSFDGRKFKNTINANDSNTTGSAISLSEDTSGNLYVSTIQGIITVSDYQTARTTEFKEFTLYTKPVKDKIWVIAKMDVQALLLIQDKMVVRKHIYTNKGEKVVVNKFFTTRDNQIIAVTTNGLYVLEDTSVKPFMQDIVKGPVMDMQQGSDGTYWLSQKNRVLQIKNNQITGEFTFDENHLINNILCDRNNNLWVCVYGEKICLIKNNKVEDISHHMVINKAFINDIIEDDEGNVWIATYENGVYEILSTDVMECTGDSEHSSLYCHKIDALDDSTVLIASIGKIFTYHNGILSPLHVRLLNAGEYTYFIKRFGDDIYIGTPYHLIKKNVLPPYHEEYAKLNVKDGAVSMYKDNAGHLYAGGFQHLFQYTNGVFIADTSAPEICHKRFWCIFRDSRNWLWLGTPVGLFCYDGKSYKTVIDSTKKAIRYITGITEDRYKRIWVGTHAGLMCIDGDKRIIYKKEQGLNSNILNTITMNNDILWLGTASGLNYINTSTLELRPYNTGVKNSEVLSLHYNKKNTLYVGTSLKLLSIDVSKLTPDNSPPKLYITSVRTPSAIFNHPLHISLTHNENKVTIDFIGLCYKSPSEVEYRYKVQDLDNNWHVTDNNSIELASLPPGEHMFALNARKNKGLWGNDVVLPITVATPFWQTFWFISIAVITLFLLVYYSMRHNILKKEYKKREQLMIYNKITYLKQQALSALINPHFIFNCMNSIQHFLNEHDNDTANDYLADFAQLIRLTLENVQDRYISLEKEISRLELYLSLEQIRFGDDLTYTINVANDIDLKSICIPNMIIQPFIENGIWHGIMPNNGKGIIDITFAKLGENELSITVKDNGIGVEFSKSQQQKESGKNQHLGISLVSERLILLEKLTNNRHTITVRELRSENGQVLGTLAEIIVPLYIDKNILDDIELHMNDGK